MRDTSERRTRGKARIAFGVLVVILAGAGGLVKLTSHDSKMETQVLGASVKTTPPPTITSGPSGPTSSTSATFKYSNSEKGVTFQCSLDNAPRESCPSTGITYSGLSETSHMFSVWAQGVSLSPSTSRNWTVDTVVPATSITEMPENPTIDTAARFRFNSETGATFECQLDGGKAGACVSPLDYKKVGVGDHAFSVVAIDAAGNRTTTAATWVWTVLINKAFGISGNAEGLLYPGTAATPLNLRFTNPYNFAISVERVDVTVQSSSSNTCGTSSNFEETTKRFDLATSVVVPANASVTLLPGDRPGNWPSIAMQNTSSSQDGCKGTTFTLSYTGTARKS